jgi:tetratricopeptide (TPR) repeat protein
MPLRLSRDNVWVKAVASVLILLCSISLTFAAGQTSEEQIERSFHAGQRALQEGSFARAVDEFKKVLALDPTLLEAEVNLGLAYQSLFEYDMAVRYLAKALRERPNLPGPTVIVGMDYLKLGSPEKAIAFLQQGLKLDPSNRDAREALASAYLSQENFRCAAEQFRQIALHEADKSEALFKLGHEYLDLAARLAYRGAHLYHESAWGHRFLGDLLFQRGRWDDALKEYQKALAIEPAQLGLHTSLGQTYLHAQKISDAEKEFRAELLSDSRNEPAWLGLANTQLAENQPKAALESLRKLWAISPEFLAVQPEFPSAELTAESIRASIAGVEDEPAGPAKDFFLAALCTAANERTCAAGEWKSFQGDFAAWHAAEQPGNEQDACKSHRLSLCIQALTARKQPTEAQRLLLGETYFTLQQYEPAADSLAQVPGVSKQNAEASYWLARTYQAQGTEAYARLQESFPNSWRACQLRAEGFALRGDFENALKEFHAALQLRADEPELHEALGELYLDHHTDDTAAQSELEKALALDPSRTRALYLLGRLFVQNKDNEKALPYLERALRLQPDFIEANSLLGTVYVRLGQFAEAVPKLEKAAPSDHYGNVHYQLYLAYRKLGRAERAQKELALSQDLRRSYLERDEALIMGSPAPQPEPQ